MSPYVGDSVVLHSPVDANGEVVGVTLRHDSDLEIWESFQVSVGGTILSREWHELYGIIRNSRPWNGVWVVTIYNGSNLHELLFPSEVPAASVYTEAEQNLVLLSDSHSYVRITREIYSL